MKSQSVADLAPGNRLETTFLTLPGGLPKGKGGPETVIVIVIEREGRIQKSWFEKRSGNALYDQSTMRAIKKADPLPPIPKEFSDNTFEIGIRFYPE